MSDANGVRHPIVLYQAPDSAVPDAEKHFERGDKVLIEHSDAQFNGAVGQVLKFFHQKGKYMVRIPSSKCKSMCTRSDDCVKACVDSRHKGWCRTDPKKMQPGIGLVMCSAAGMTMAAESDYFAPVAVDGREEYKGFGHSAYVSGSDRSDAMPTQPPSSAFPESGGDSSSSASVDTSHTSVPSRKRPAADHLSPDSMSSAVRDFLVCEIGLTEEFAEVSANATITQALESMHFQPYVRRKLQAHP